LYERGIIFKQYFSPVPVVCIGNIRVGGTGKSQVIISVAEKLLEKGQKVAVLSRGYKRKTKGFSEVSSFDSEKFGDEPVMIKKLIPDAYVFVSENRVKGIKQILSKYKLDFILLDDGLQNYSVKKDYEICLIDKTYCSKNLVERLLIPAGNLREPRSQVYNFDCIIFNNKFDDTTKTLDLREKIGEKLYWAEYRLKGFFNELGNEVLLDQIKESKNLVFCGIAQPESFKKLFLKYQIPFENFIFYPDHKKYNLEDSKRLIKFAEKFDCKFLITTNKDFVKIQKFINEFKRAGVLPIFVKITAILENYDKIINDMLCLKRKS